MKVDQQPNREPTEPEISDDLGLVHGQQAFNGFDLDQDFGVHYQIESIGMLQFKSLVTDRQYLLPFPRQAQFAQLVTQTLFVCRLEQTWAQVAVDFDASPDQDLRTIVKTSRLPAFLSHVS
jgi:hypothetical protein